MRTLARTLVGATLAFAIGAPALAQWSTDKLSSARENLGATSVGGKALFAGGAGLSAVVDIYDDATGTWTTAQLSAGRTLVVGTSVGNYALFATGIGGPNVVDIYDVSTGLWSVHTVSVGTAWSSATTVGTKAMFAGGSIDLAFQFSDVVDIYDSSIGPPTDANAWSTATLSQERAAIGATSVGQYALFAGGMGDINSNVTYDTVDIYDDSTGLWSTHTLSQARSRVAAASVGGKAFFAGGTGGGFHTVVDIYDSSIGPPTDANAWSGTTLSQARATVATTVGSRVLFGGGWNSSPGSNRVDIYDDATGLWSTSTLSLGRKNLAATSVGDKAIFGGGNRNGPKNRVDFYDLDFGERYCSPAVANSTGLPGVTMAFGRTSVAMNDFSLTAEQLPLNQFGYFLNSQTQANTFPVPNSQGALCVGGAIGRYNATVFNTGTTGTGSLQLDLANTPTPSGTVSIQQGETWNFTAWYRDLNPTTTSNFTDGVSIGFQ